MAPCDCHVVLLLSLHRGLQLSSAAAWLFCPSFVIAPSLWLHGLVSRQTVCDGGSVRPLLWHILLDVSSSVAVPPCPSTKGPHGVHVCSERLLVSVDVLPLGP